MADDFEITAEERGAHSKIEWEPLLAAGFYDRTLTEIRELCVDAFPQSLTRSRIMGGVEWLSRKLDTEGIATEVWLDGSFLTKKPDPNDADILN